jgi:hypothetical protein
MATEAAWLNGPTAFQKAENRDFNFRDLSPSVSPCREMVTQYTLLTSIHILN